MIDPILLQEQLGGMTMQVLALQTQIKAKDAEITSLKEELEKRPPREGEVP